MKFALDRVLVLVVLQVAALPRLLAQQPKTIATAQAKPAAPSAILPEALKWPSQTPVQSPSSQPAYPTPTYSSDGSQLTTDSDGVYTISRTARLVVLDLVVTDAKGKIVKGLNRGDFHVEEAGKPQAILNFEEGGSHTPDPTLTINSTADLDHFAPNAPVNIILLDEFNTRLEDMSFVRYSLKRYLGTQPSKLDMPTMLIAVDLQHFAVLRDYTQNKDEILSALDHHFGEFPWQAKQGAWLSERYAMAFGTLRSVTEAVIGHPGHKNMIWIGRGFPPLNFANMPGDIESHINSSVQDCVNALRDARVTLYTIDPAGILTDRGAYGDVDPDADSNNATLPDPFGGNYQFARLATATGGRALFGRNDVDVEIGTAIRDGSSFYTLSYRPSDTTPQRQRFRGIRVSVDLPGLTVIAPQGYYLLGQQEEVNAQKPSPRLSSDLLSAESSAMVYDGLPISLRRSPSDPDSFMVHVDASGLTWTYATDTEPRQAEIVLLVATFDRKGKELNRDARVMKIKAPLTEPPIGRLERSLDINYKLNRDPKVFRARFVIRAANSGRIGTAEAILDQQIPPSAPMR
jgi:VWFA-related protein